MATELGLMVGQPLYYAAGYCTEEERAQAIRVIECRALDRYADLWNDTTTT